jgi:hypothetical protein
MINKIKTALKTKYATLGLGEKAFDGVAEYLVKTVTEDAQIDTAITGMDGLLKVFQSEADRRVSTLQQEKTELENKLKEVKPVVTPPQNGGATDPTEPAWAKALREQNEAILSKQALADKASKENNLRESAKKLMIEKGIESKLCDDLLNLSPISETDTIESISLKGVDTYNALKTKFAPETGSPSASIGVIGDDKLDAYFKQKEESNLSKTKLIEDVIKS